MSAILVRVEALHDRIDPALVRLATSLRADAATSRVQRPDRLELLPEASVVRPPEAQAGTSYVVGLVGSVAVGKSVAAAQLAKLLGPGVEVVSTDAFLLPNEQLEPLGGAMRKGYPESFDWEALERFFTSLRSERAASTPVYSHEEFDILPGVSRTFAVPGVVIVEGLNLLQDPPGGRPAVVRHLDRSVYLDADTAVIEDWFVRRFISLARPNGQEPSDFYLLFATMTDDELEASARWVWSEINEPNLRQHIAPTRDRADVVVRKGPNHEIERLIVRG